MSGAEIAADVSAALDEVAGEVGDGSFQVTILRPGTPPTKPSDPPAVPVPYPLNAMVTAYAKDQIDGTLIQSGDVRVFLDATGITPAKRDRVQIDTGPFAGEYAIIGVEPAAYAGVSVFHRLHCRK